jgi:hypothetical protein
MDTLSNLTPASVVRLASTMTPFKNFPASSVV